jgi:SAM-dependent methyltransferase
MAASLNEMTRLRAYQRASRELQRWVEGARVLALLSGALESGVLDLVATGGTPAAIAADTGLTESDVDRVCRALEVHGVTTRDGAEYRMTPGFSLLASPSAAVPLASVIRQAKAMARTLERPPEEAIYSALPPAEIVAMAEGAGISALSEAPHVSAEVMAKSLPEVEALWRAGARHLEVGCGVGNALLGIAATYPGVEAVGIEIDEATAAEATRRAALLGLTARVEVRCMDVCDLRDEEIYDTIQWSQFFFPHASRLPALRAMQRALRPGGYLFMPWLGNASADGKGRRWEMLRRAARTARAGSAVFPAFLLDAMGDTARRRRTEGRLSALMDLLFGRWGVPVLPIRGLAAEVEEGGFRVVRTMHAPVSQFALTRGFLLAQRIELMQ